MEVRKVYINTYKNDFSFAKICIASIRYWYPKIPIILIKDLNAGNFDTYFVEKEFDVQVLNVSRTKFGWGYGKFEPLFIEGNESFLILDADTVLTGPVIDTVAEIESEFIVDEEVQPDSRLGEIYYDLATIKTIEPEFVYPGYSFNTGQWFGTTGILERESFSKVIEWTEPPKLRHPGITFNGDQGAFNFVLQWHEQLGKLRVARQKLMIWPDNGSADFISLNRIREKSIDYPYVIHWAGMKYNRFKELARADIISFYQDRYYDKAGIHSRVLDNGRSQLFKWIKKIKRGISG
jgi:hypothetical protein